MKILHTGDWHLGKRFYNISLEEDFEFIIDQVKTAIVEKNPETIILAGDIYDRAAPPKEAMTLFNSFCEFVKSSGKNLIIIAGNHDSRALIEGLGTLAPSNTFLVRGKLTKDEKPIILEDKHGKVAISGLPFAYEYEAKDVFDDPEINTPEDVIKAQINSAKKYVKKEMRWVVVAHTFVGSSVKETEGERPISFVGGVENVSHEVFEGVDYVALGHIHKPQKIKKDTIRYAGAPLAFGFDEHEEKSMTFIEMGKKGDVIIETLPFKPIRRPRTIEGKMSDLLKEGNETDDFIQIILTDDKHQSDAMRKLQNVYKNAVSLSYKKDERVRSFTEADIPSIEGAEPLDVISSFLHFSRDVGPDEKETDLIQEKIKVINEESTLT